jgi:hypothetical protein
VASVNLQIADAIVLEINNNASGLSIPGIVAERMVTGYRSLPEFESTKVGVFPSVLERILESRQQIQKRFEYTLQVQKRLVQNEVPDQYMQLSEEIVDLLDFHTILTPIKASWRESITETIFEEDLMEDSHLFSAVTRLVYSYFPPVS